MRPRLSSPPLLPRPVPSLFWFEIRNILAVSERRGRIGAGGALINMERVRRLPLDDAGIGGDGSVLLLAASHSLSAYDAAYLALAANRSLPLATLDRKLAAAAGREALRFWVLLSMATDRQSGTAVDRRAGELDTIAAVLPIDRRDKLAEILTGQDVKTLRHLVNEGMGDNTLRVLTSDLAYLEAWTLAATSGPLPWPAPESLLLKFAAHHLWDPAAAKPIPIMACQRTLNRICAMAASCAPPVRTRQIRSVGVWPTSRR